MENIESKVADTILQRNKEIKVGDKTYSVAPPTIATLILVSEAIAKMPAIENGSTLNIVSPVLKNAKLCNPLGEIAAIIILGAKRIREGNVAKRTWYGRKLKPKDQVAELAAELLESLSPKAMNEFIAEAFRDMQLGDFFGLTTFLGDVNITKTTKVENPTASGQQ